MEIAISGEGDAPARRCGATLALTDDIVAAYDDQFEEDFSDYKSGCTVVDTDFESQTVVGTPKTENDDDETGAILLTIGITKGLYDALMADEGIDDDSVIKISGEEMGSDITMTNPLIYKDEDNNCAIVGTIQVSVENSTVLAEDDWDEMSIYKTDETLFGTYEVSNDNSYAPTDLIFTPAPVEETPGEE